MVVRYEHFWIMAQEIRTYCRVSGLRVLSKDSQEDRTIGFATDLPEGDPRFREYRIRLADVSRTANRRNIGFENFTEAEMLAVTHPHLMNSEGRRRVAEVLSLGIVGPVGPVDSSAEG